MDVAELQTSFSQLLTMLQGCHRMLVNVRSSSEIEWIDWLNQITVIPCMSSPVLSDAAAGNSSISNITNALEEITRQRRCIRILHADNDAAECWVWERSSRSASIASWEVPGCRQMFDRSLNTRNSWRRR